jgi:hypothetical protein
VPLAVAALRHARAAVVPALAALALIAAVNLAASSALSDGLSRNRYLTLPGLGALRWISGLNYAAGDIRKQVPGPPARFVERDRGWPRADRLLAAWIV